MGAASATPAPVCAPALATLAHPTVRSPSKPTRGAWLPTRRPPSAPRASTTPRLSPPAPVSAGTLPPSLRACRAARGRDWPCQEADGWAIALTDALPPLLLDQTRAARTAPAPARPTIRAPATRGGLPSTAASVRAQSCPLAVCARGQSPLCPPTQARAPRALLGGTRLRQRTLLTPTPSAPTRCKRVRHCLLPSPPLIRTHSPIRAFMTAPLAAARAARASRGAPASAVRACALLCPMPHLTTLPLLAVACSAGSSTSGVPCSGRGRCRTMAELATLATDNGVTSAQVSTR